MHIRISNVDSAYWEDAVACARLHLAAFPDPASGKVIKAYVLENKKYYVHRTPTGIAVRGGGKIG